MGVWYWNGCYGNRLGGRVLESSGLKIGENGGLLCTLWWTSRLHKTQRVSHLADPLKNSALTFLNSVDLSEGSWLLSSFLRPTIYFHLLVQSFGLHFHMPVQFLPLLLYAWSLVCFYSDESVEGCYIVPVAWTDSDAFNEVFLSLSYFTMQHVQFGLNP